MASLHARACKKSINASDGGVEEFVIDGKEITYARAKEEWQGKGWELLSSKDQNIY